MEKLHSILKTMDVPPLRFNDLHWLNRNIQINNGNHPDLKLALQLIKNLLNKGAQEWKTLCLSSF